MDADLHGFWEGGIQVLPKICANLRILLPTVPPDNRDLPTSPIRVHPWFSLSNFEFSHCIPAPR
jgi:hypothetical protein